MTSIVYFLVLPPVIDRLGDLKDPVSFILHIIELERKKIQGFTHIVVLLRQSHIQLLYDFWDFL